MFPVETRNNYIAASLNVSKMYQIGPFPMCELTECTLHGRLVPRLRETTQPEITQASQQIEERP
jgi:hypothetical protein